MMANYFDLESLRMSLWRELNDSANSIIEEADTDNKRMEQTRLILKKLQSVEAYWAYPGREVLYKLEHYLSDLNPHSFKLLTQNTYHSIEQGYYKKQEFIPFYTNLNNLDMPQSKLLESDFTRNEQAKKSKIYFEILIIHPNPEEYEFLYRNSLAAYKNMQDSFLFDVVFVNNYQDAIIAVLSNPDIQSCVYVAGFNYSSALNSELTSEYDNFIQYNNDFISNSKNCDSDIDRLCFDLKDHLESLRPEMDHFFITEMALDERYYQKFDRIIMGTNLFADLHHHLISGLEQRYATPFFDALRSYAAKPKGVFHALPISQAQSINNSHSIADVVDFYGTGIFAAETSSTLGGMDSLMDPKGSISQAQNKAAKVFQSQQSFFITNGTTSANKIVMQANLCPDDIVLISSDCHKSIPYSIFLSGAKAIFLETYPLNEYDLYGCVTLERIKEVLLDLKVQGKLQQVKQITLTNSTFDGVIYDVRRFMLEILAIKADMIFHWDEAWFSFAYFNPVYKYKTAMGTANYLFSLINSQSYREFYHLWLEDAELENNDWLLNNPLYPDPDQFKVRVYATQSIHKTLTAFRQASMLHIYDQLFVKDNFFEAYRTHTSTSPNYQIIASLDFARRQMSLEGYQLIKKALLLAENTRNRIKNCALLSKYFKVLSDAELVPNAYQCSKVFSGMMCYAEISERFQNALFCVDPTRITLDISATGIDGPNFRQLLMTQYDIQVNKTSRNTILLIINIGINNDSLHYLMDALYQIAAKLEHSVSKQDKKPSTIINLPQTRLYHQQFIQVSSLKKNNFQAVNIRKAYYAGMKNENIEYILLTNDLLKRILNDYKLISAAFVTPYPPGFPIIVPGQIISYDILIYLQKIQIKEIHGYHSEKGLKIFNQNYLNFK